MFYCEACRLERKWPETLSRSKGCCELCSKHGSCYDLSSTILARLTDTNQVNAESD